MPHTNEATTTRKRRFRVNERLSSEEETSLTYAIFDEEKKIISVLSGVEEAQVILNTTPVVKEKTRAGFVDREDAAPPRPHRRDAREVLQDGRP